MLGAGWRVCGPAMPPHVVAVLVTVPWEDTNRQHRLRLELIDEDGHPAMVPGLTGDEPMRAEGNLEVGRPPGIPAGMEIDAPFVLNVGGGLPLAPDHRYIWQLWINDETHDEWRQPFFVRPAGASPAA